MKNLKSIFYSAFFIVLSTTVFAQTDTLKYIFLGHTYGYYDVNNLIDSRVKDIDVKGYDGIWLGGDVCSESLMKYSTLELINNTFNLNHPNTHWALGNHDARNGNWIWLEELTGHKTYYTSNLNRITYIVLNTNLTPFDCEQLDDQYKIIVNVCDTITKSTHLILLMHHGLWDGVPGLVAPMHYAQSNLKYYNFYCKDFGSNFVNEIYPRLVEIKQKGVEVICIMGDIGAIKVDFVSDDGITFLGAGLQKSIYKDPEARKNAAADYAIVFKHLPSKGWLEWEHVDFDLLSGYTY